MTDIVDQIINSGDHIAVFHPKSLHNIYHHTNFQQPSNHRDGKVGEIHAGSQTIDIYSSTVINEDFKTYDFRNKLAPHMLDTWFESLYPHILEVQNKNKKDEDTVYSVNEKIKLPDNTEMKLSQNISVSPRAYETSEMDLEKKAKKVLKNELNREVAKRYYTNDN